MPQIRTAARWGLRAVLLALGVVIAGAVAILIVLPRASHGTALTVLTGSMTPDIPVGSVVIDRPVDPGTLHVGDVATYQKAPGVNEYITHRIVGINTKTNPVTFTFQGDANRGPDITPVPASAIRGKVWFHVPYLGAIRDSIQSHGMRAVALLLAIVGLAGFALSQLVSAARARKRARSATLRLEVAADAFGDVDPQFVARLLDGSVESSGADALEFTFTDSARFTVLRELLARYDAHVLDGAPSPAGARHAEDSTDDPATGEATSKLESAHA